jgi:hypothetical protein
MVILFDVLYKLSITVYLSESYSTEGADVAIDSACRYRLVWTEM